jgi:hypothetical protein
MKIPRRRRAGGVPGAVAAGTGAGGFLRFMGETAAKRHDPFCYSAGD